MMDKVLRSLSTRTVRARLWHGLMRQLGRRVVEHGPDQLGFFGGQHGLDLDHAVFGARTDALLNKIDAIASRL